MGLVEICLPTFVINLNQIQSCRFGPENQYLDPAWYHLWRNVSEILLRGQICNLEIVGGNIPVPYRAYGDVNTPT